MPVFRIEIAPQPTAADPAGQAALHQAEAAGLHPIPSDVKTTAIYLIEGDLDDSGVANIAHSILHDPVTQTHFEGSRESKADATIEIHPLPVVDFSVDPVCEGDTFSFRDNSFVDQTIFSDNLSPSNSTSPIFNFAGITSSNTTPGYWPNGPPPIGNLWNF